MGLVAKAFQDIITFSRASSGTYVNSSGYITQSSVLNYLTYSNQPENAAWTKSNSFVQQNLVTYSEDFTNAAWTAIAGNVTNSPNSTIAPDGTVTADLIYPTTTGTNRRIIRQLSLTSSVVYTQSIYIKSAGFQWVMIAAVNAASAADSCWFDIVNGVKGTIGGDAITTSITAVSGAAGWFRITLTGTADAVNDYFIVTLADANGSSTATASGTNGVYIWGAQLVQGSVPGDYRATTSAALPCLYADYNGALRARKLSETAVTNVHLLQNNVATVGASQVVSVYAKAAERSQLYLQVGTTGAYFNLSTGAVISGSGATITLVRDGWYRCEVSASPVLTNFNVFVAVANGGVGSYAGDGSSGIYIADAQLNDGSSALAYYDTTASAYNAPRFDYDPVTLAAKGLLVEELRQNLLLRSNDWSATWNNTNITRTAAAALGPDGQMSMTKLEATASAATNSLQPVVATATSHTYSIYAKKGSGATDSNAFAVYNSTTATTLASITINYDTGVVTQTVGTGATATASGNNIWRIVIPVTSGITIGNTLNVYSCYLGGPETAGEFAYVYGAQLEAGAFATSYIPTVGSQVTRAADVASVNTLSPWFNSVAGTLYAEFSQFQVTSGTSRLAWIDDVDTALYQNFVSLGNNTINSEAIAYVGGAAQASLFRQTVTANTVGKTAFAFTANDFAECFNGGTVATDTSGTLPSGLDKMWLGTYRDSTYLNGHLRRITYYPRRLTNAELQTLTTL